MKRSLFSSILCFTGILINVQVFSLQVRISFHPGMLISAADTVLCQGQQTRLYSIVSGGSGKYSYQWYDHWWQPVSPDSFIDLTIIGSNNMKLVVNDGLVKDTASIKIFSKTVYQPNISLNTDAGCEPMKVDIGMIFTAPKC